MNLSLQMDLVKYRHTMNQFMVKLNADGVLLLKEEMRLLLRDILRFTAPKNLAQGRRAVAGDMRNLARPLDWKNIQMPALAKAVHARGVRAVEAITKNLKGEWGARTLLTSLSAIKDAHERNRSRYGRVKGDRHNMAFLVDWSKYLRAVQSRVGLARAGWWRAAQGVGLALPPWVSRHNSYAPGAYLPPRPSELAITAINRSVKIPNYQDRHVTPAVRARAASMASELARLLKGGKSRRGSLANTPTGQA